MPTLFTAGHSNRSAEELCALLRGASVAVLADVRRFPVSRRQPWFAKDALSDLLGAHGIAYYWLGAGLGGRREPRFAFEDSPNRAWSEPALRSYADALDTPEFRDAAAELEGLALELPTCVLCAERDWRHCHRQILADWLVVRGFEVVHLLDPEHREPHRLTPSARVHDGHLSYPTLL